MSLSSPPKFFPRLATTGMTVPPYRSLKRGVNVELFEVNTGMEMRRLKEDEMDAFFGGDVAESDTHLFCFHVRSPPPPPRKRPCSSYDTITLDSSDETPDILSFEPSQELQLSRASLPSNKRTRPRKDPNTGLPIVMEEEESDSFTMRVHSFIPAPNHKHGVLWCSM